MLEFVGWDIGGVHLKAARLSFRDGRLAGARAVVRFFEVWRNSGGMPAALSGMLRELEGTGAAHALTMTAELADCFRSKTEGVLAVVSAARKALAGGPMRFWGVEAGFASAAEAEREPLAFAASNWLATCEVAARCAGEGLLLDIGSTTTDIVPFASGEARPRARDDTGRLVSGELVYTGVLRTPLAALAPEVPLGGSWCRLSPEPFASTADMYLVLGRLTSAHVTTPTADGGPLTAEASCTRLARVLCCDPGGLERARLVQVARFLESAQLGSIERAARQVVSSASFAHQPVIVATGLGRFLAPRLAARLELPWRDLSELIPLSDPQAAPATCVALLLAEEALGVRGPQAWSRPG